MPWNFPFLQVVRFAAPALMAGNAALLKHAPNSPGCALALEQAFTRRGPARGPVPRAARRRRRASGSDGADHRRPARRRRHADRQRARRRGRRRRRRRGAEEERARARRLGPVHRARRRRRRRSPRRWRPRARFINAGQSCIAAKRFIVDDAVADEFERRFVEAVEAITVGDPLEAATGLGPLARADLREALDAQVRASVDARARVLTGGTRSTARATSTRRRSWPAWTPG